MRQWAEANTPQNNAAQFHQIDAPAESTNNSRAAKSNIFLVSQVKNLTIQIWGKKNNPTNWAHQQRYISTAQCRCGGAKISQTSLNFIFHHAIRKLSPQTNSLSSPNQANNGSVQKSTTVYRTIKTKRINIWDTRGAGSSTAPGRIRGPRRDAVPFAGSQTRIHHGGADRRARPRIGGGEGRRDPRWQESPRSIRGGEAGGGVRGWGSRLRWGRGGRRRRSGLWLGVPPLERRGEKRSGGHRGGSGGRAYGRRIWEAGFQIRIRMLLWGGAGGARSSVSRAERGTRHEARGDKVGPTCGPRKGGRSGLVLLWAGLQTNLGWVLFFFIFPRNKFTLASLTGGWI